MGTDYTGAQLGVFRVIRVIRGYGTRSTLMDIVPDSFMLAPPRPDGAN